MKNPADNVEQWAIDKLIPYARNARTHSPQQIDQIAASIKEWGWTTPVLIDPDGGIIAGHGRTLAAKKLGIKTVPVIIAIGWTEAQKRAYVIADNKLALNAGWDAEVLKWELHALQELEFDLEMTGFDPSELSDIMFGDALKIPDIGEEQSVKAAFEVAVECESENEQQKVYEMLTEKGFKCRVLSM